MDQELVPLEAGVPRPRPSRQTSVPNRSCYKGPIRLCRLLILMIVLPSICIFTPLYMKYRVFSGQMYPMSMTDMRLIDGKISPTWCQTQVVKSNATFNAFVVPDLPELTEDLVPVSMTRQLELEDDMKEYWGFYLLKGSTVTVSACCRWPGASLIMIKGYKHLQECAYIGDDSSEELDELLEAHQLGLMNNATLWEKIMQLKKEDGKANDPEAMKRHKAGVSFHDPSHVSNVTSSAGVPDIDVTDHDPKELRAILEHLHALRQAAKNEALKDYHPPSHLISLPSLHRHRDTNVDKDERQWISFKDIDGNSSISATQKTELDSSIMNSSHVNINLNSTTDYSIINNTTQIKNDSIDTESMKVNNSKKILNDIDKMNDKQKESENDAESSKEVFLDVLNRLQALGDRGKRVLVRLHESMGVGYKEKDIPDVTRVMSAVRGSDEELERLRKVLVEAIDEEKTRPQRQEKRRVAREDARTKRQLMLGHIELTQQLNADDEARDYAAEEGLSPDGYAEHHQTVNETTPFDMSNSEFWSSFSSSEEALLECEGLILNLPLTPHRECHDGADTLVAARANALTYRVPANGYYFFVFNSENEVQKNFIKARFDLQKTRYDVARTTLRECRNKTDRCDLPLDIFSSQKVVLELPLRNNDSLWNEQFVIISECEPRTSVYIVCVLAVPVLIMIFAFQ
ncbi:uncharacterized protein LOC123711216 isoform X1 [Pieris brassicae]|uniref:uncharacterized protein LOC123711216 isoform X1 n=1 Tax=Pieris brassicae TaxID=7116 RepID=UPI001E660E9D|nr:uncharacterized protein LOC123711216 isoform X1 [Pieris brassicae]XP_045519654.1 uncharacterized protein LOC123711216 isoform X1 [Pieris brassicae]XP_045519655.1 uncharacterized protein LOC123711216 isoform X1 [Pieris brassicae]